jgi:branched-chain amino acid transport system substrate-binding protein
MKTISMLKVLMLVGICIVAILGFGKPAMSYTEYKIGITLPRSGDQAFVGDMQIAGVETAIEEINAKGGIDGVPLKLVVEDNQAKPTTAVTAFQKLITVDKVPLVLTTYSPTQLHSASRGRNKVVMVNIAASSTELINAAKYMFT